MLVHLGRRRQPQTSRQVAFDFFQQLTGCAEVTDVSHARTDKDFVDLLALNGGQQTGVVRIVRCAENRLVDVGQVNFDDLGVLSVFVSFH
jgi:hypothetical protein